MQRSGVFLGLCAGLRAFDGFRSRNMCAAGLLDLGAVWLWHCWLPPWALLMSWEKPRSQKKKTCLAHPTSAHPQAFHSVLSAFLTHAEYPRKQGPCVVCTAQVPSRSLRPTPAALDNCIQMCTSNWCHQASRPHPQTSVDMTSYPDQLRPQTDCNVGSRLFCTGCVCSPASLLL